MEVNEIVEMLNKYPDLKERIKEMLAIVEGPIHGEFSTADAIEERAVGVVRRMGHNLMESWANQQSAQTSLQIQEGVPSAKKNIKKKSTGTARSEKLK